MVAPNIKVNMAPPANFWEGDKFRIGVPGFGVGAGNQQGGGAMPSPTPSNPAVNGPPTNWAAYLQANPDVQRAYDQNIGRVQSRYPTAEAYAEQFHYPQFGINENRASAPQGFAGPVNPSPQTMNPAVMQFMNGKNPFLGGM